MCVCAVGVHAAADTQDQRPTVVTPRRDAEFLEFLEHLPERRALRGPAITTACAGSARLLRGGARAYECGDGRRARDGSLLSSHPAACPVVVSRSPFFGASAVKTCCLAEAVDLACQAGVVEISHRNASARRIGAIEKAIGLIYRADRDLDIENPQSSVVAFGHDILHALVPGATIEKDLSLSRTRACCVSSSSIRVSARTDTKNHRPTTFVASSPVMAISQFRDSLDRLGLGQYHDGLVQEAFDSWEVLADITEEDLYVARKIVDCSSHIC